MESKRKAEGRRVIIDPLVEKFQKELKNLHEKGGVRDIEKIEELSAEFRLACGVPPGSDDLHAVQGLVAETLSKLSERIYNDEEKQAFRVGFNLDDGLNPGLDSRRDNLASELQIVSKTVRNREGRAIYRVALHLAGRFKSAGKEEPDDRGDTHEVPGAVVVRESPFARDFNLDGFYWEDLSVHITFDSVNERFEVSEQHWLVATRDGLDRVGLVVSPAFFVVDGTEIREDEDQTSSWRRPDTIMRLSGDANIRIMWLEKPFSAGQRIWLIRNYYLHPEACCYIVTPLGPFGRLEVTFNGRGVFGKTIEEQISWIVPGILPQFIPELAARPPFNPDGPPESVTGFQPQHYCWVNLPSPDADENSDCTTAFEQLIPGLSYGVGWSVYRNETPRPQPDEAEDGDGVSGEEGE